MYIWSGLAQITKHKEMIYKIIKSALLIVIAISLIVFLAPFAVAFEIIHSIVKTRGQSLVRYFKKIALSIDQTGNAICKTLFDNTLIRRGAYNKFGNMDETVSSALGKNKRDNSLTGLGEFVVFILDALDENHSEDAIDDSVSQKT